MLTDVVELVCSLIEWSTVVNCFAKSRDNIACIPTKQRTDQQGPFKAVDAVQNRRIERYQWFIWVTARRQTKKLPFGPILLHDDKDQTRVDRFEMSPIECYQRWGAQQHRLRWRRFIKSSEAPERSIIPGLKQWSQKAIRSVESILSSCSVRYDRAGRKRNASILPMIWTWPLTGVELIRSSNDECHQSRYN